MFLFLDGNVKLKYSFSMQCPKCKVQMVSSFAVENTLNKPFAGDGVTICKNGPPVLVPCEKCPQCGHSKRNTDANTDRWLGDC